MRTRFNLVVNDCLGQKCRIWVQKICPKMDCKDRLSTVEIWSVCHMVGCGCVWLADTEILDPKARIESHTRLDHSDEGLASRICSTLLYASWCSLSPHITCHELFLITWLLHEQILSHLPHAWSRNSHLPWGSPTPPQIQQSINKVQDLVGKMDGNATVYVDLLESSSGRSVDGKRHFPVMPCPSCQRLNGSLGGGRRRVLHPWNSTPSTFDLSHQPTVYFGI